MTAAALVDLHTPGWLTVDHAARLHTRTGLGPLDDLGVFLMDAIAIATAPRRAVRAWLLDLAPAVHTGIAHRLHTTGLITPVRTRTLLGRRVQRWPVPDLLHAADHTPRAHLRQLPHLAATGRRVPPDLAVTAVLIAIVGAGHRLHLALPDGLLVDLFAFLPDEVQAICRGVHTAIGARAASPAL